MGIPAFYRWLVERYPLSVVKVVEESPKVVNGVQIPIDTTSPNPNGIEFDNLYLDMNGIIHPCFHPEDKPPPSSYDEVFKAVFKYIDHIFSLIRPRKLIFMAIDGVAPRAKMNQQRARRFRSAKDAVDAAAEAEKLTSELDNACNRITAQTEKSSKMDSNVITPGTEFMASLSLSIRYYIHLRLNNDPGWRNIKVILSDANVPGEGEHKVASYIRAQRNLPGFDPNTRHCLYGLDADLIMLALATHEIHFSILREDVQFARKNQINSKPNMKSNFSHQRRRQLEREDDDSMRKIKFQFLHIWILREYLEHDLRISDAKQKFNFERLIDDFVFICLFVGNDFLPHIPSLEISEGAIDLLMNVYKKEFSRMGGYLTNSFEVDLERVEHFLRVVGSHENAIFRRRIQLQKERDIHFGAASSTAEVEQKNGSSWMESTRDSSDLICRDSSSNGGSCNPAKDQVKMREEVWKERYYAEKFEVKTEDDLINLRRDAVMKYVEGICWFMHYYYQGVCSWQWFYPYHYAPFASDFLDLKQLEIRFTLGTPFKPFNQLMGVLPAASAHALPSSYRKLMTDPSSSIIDFYPSDFELDLNGKRWSWQAVCKLPFVEEPRLLQEIEKVEHTLTDDEKQRNKCALDALFVHISHPLASKVVTFYMKKKDHPKLSKVKLKRKLDAKVSAGMNGYIYISDKTFCSSEIYSPVEDMETVTKNKTISVYYKGPPIQMHIPRIADGATLPPKLLSKKDVPPPPVLWHNRSTAWRRIYSGRARIANQGSALISREKKESNHKNDFLGKRKRIDFQNGKGMINRQESYTNGSNLGKTKHRRRRGGKKHKSRHH